MLTEIRAEPTPICITASLTDIGDKPYNFHRKCINEKRKWNGKTEKEYSYGRSCIPSRSCHSISSFHLYIFYENYTAYPQYLSMTRLCKLGWVLRGFLLALTVYLWISMPDVRHFNECILIHAAKLPLFEGTEMDRKSAKVIFC